MEFVFLMKFKLQDATDSLDVFLFRDAVSFYHPWASWRRKNPTKDAAWAGYDISVCSCHQELFFGVTAEDAAANQEAQSRVCRIVESICPPEGSTGTCLLNTNTPEQVQATPPQLQKNNLRRHAHAWLSCQSWRFALCHVSVSLGERPWLHLCLVSYSREDNFGQNQTCYQICHSAIASSSPGLQAPCPPPFWMCLWLCESQEHFCKMLSVLSAAKQ